MTDEAFTKYGVICDQFSDNDNGHDERKGLTNFLRRTDVTLEQIALWREEFNAELQRGKLYGELLKNPIFEWIFYIDEFEKLGTIKSNIPSSFWVERIKEYRHRKSYELKR
jgi:hypothetical protein